MRPVFAALLLLAACAPATNGDPDAGDGGTPGEPDPAYFGLEAHRCFLFSESTGLSYSILVETNAVAIPGKTLYTLQHFLNGQLAQTDYLEATGEGLRYWRRDEQDRTEGTNTQRFFRFTDGPLWLTEALTIGEPLEHATAARYAETGAAEVDATYTLKTEMLEDVSLTTPGGTFQTQRLIVTLVDADDVPVRTDKLWFAPGTGIVKIDPNGSGIKEATFKGLKTLDLTAPTGDSRRYCVEDV